MIDLNRDDISLFNLIILPFRYSFIYPLLIRLLDFHLFDLFQAHFGVLSGSPQLQ